MKFLKLGYLMILVSVSSYAQKYIADYEVANETVLRSIPEFYINKARSELHIAYQHTSHGTHVTRGLYGLPDYKSGDETLFAVSITQESGKLDVRDYAMESYAADGTSAVDLTVEETAFIQATRNYLDDPANAEINVIMWSWCTIALNTPEINYLPGMDSLISEYGPGGSKIGTGVGQREVPVTFIFMTGVPMLNSNEGYLYPEYQANAITSHCLTNGYFCMDYYSIDTHDMNDNYWVDADEDGNSALYGGNYLHDWINSHTLGVDYYENKETPGGIVNYGAHTTQHLTANRKGYAMWWLLARIAGWDGVSDVEDNTPPTVPISLAFSGASENSITIAWNASTDDVGVVSYNVYRNGTFLGSTENLSYTDETVTDCNTYLYSVSALDAAGNESDQSDALSASYCVPDVTPTLIVTPNISHGIANFDVIVRVTELSQVNTSGEIVVNIPIDSRWDIDGAFDQTLTVIDGFPLNNSDWTHSTDGVNHVFTLSSTIDAGSFSSFGFRMVFNPDVNRGVYTITTQIVSGGGGEARFSNNADSERLDYFQ